VPAISVALALLLVWPVAASAFHGPKSLVLGIGGLLGLIALRRARLHVGASSWLGLVLISLALTGSFDAPVAVTWVAFGLALITWPWLAPRVEETAAWLLPALAVASLVVLLQAVGVDVFEALRGEVSGRARLFGTLGNADFVASALGAAGWLAVPARSRWRWPCLALVVASLVVTRSFASVLAFCAAGLFVLVSVGPRPVLRRSAVVGVLVAVMLALAVKDRSLLTAAQGRWYLTKVAAPQLGTAGLFGLGPGVVELRWADWELAFWTERCGEDRSCVERDPDRRFADLQDHVHDDWLELVLELGWPGALALVAVLARALRSARRHAPFAGAAIISLGVRALFDFPLHRPADLAVLALAVALSLSAEQAAAAD
jgi:hypothetical protein